MSDKTLREVVTLRYELRERLAAEVSEGTKEILQRLQELAAAFPDTPREQQLRVECDRWRLRFELLAAINELA